LNAVEASRGACWTFSRELADGFEAFKNATAELAGRYEAYLSTGVKRTLDWTTIAETCRLTKSD
jgi:hypothetical protein